MRRMDRERPGTASSIKALSSKVYEGWAGSRNPILDGPWWLGAVVLASIAVHAVVEGPWRWLILPVAFVFILLPLGIRWAVALGRSAGAFQDGLSSK